MSMSTREGSKGSCWRHRERTRKNDRRSSLRNARGLRDREADTHSECTTQQRNKLPSGVLTSGASNARAATISDEDIGISLNS